MRPSRKTARQKDFARNALNSIAVPTRSRRSPFRYNARRPVESAPPTWHLPRKPRSRKAGMQVSLVVALWLAVAAPAVAQDIVLPLPLGGRAALETGLDLAASALANALQHSRDQARAEGTFPCRPISAKRFSTGIPPTFSTASPIALGLPRLDCPILLAPLRRSDRRHHHRHHHLRRPLGRREQRRSLGS